VFVCILPGKAVPKMTYTVSGGTLNPTHSLTEMIVIYCLGYVMHLKLLFGVLEIFAVVLRLTFQYFPPAIWTICALFICSQLVVVFIVVLCILLCCRWQLYDVKLV